MDWDTLALLACGMRWETQLGFGAVTLGFRMAEGPFAPVLKYEVGVP